MIGANGAYILAINWGLKIYRQLNSVKHLMTSRTVRLQTNMTIMLAVQVYFDWVFSINPTFKHVYFKALFPFMASSLPVCLFIIAVTFQLNIPNLGMHMAIIAVWMPVVSPFCTIFLLGWCYIKILSFCKDYIDIIGVYRRRILAFLRLGQSSSSRTKALQVTATITEFTRVTRPVKI